AFAGSPLDGLAVNLNLSPDARVFAYTLLVSSFAAVLFGLLPSLQTAKPELTHALKDEGVFGGQRIQRSRLRSFLIAGQVAVSLVFLIGAGLLVRGVFRSQDVDVGYDTRNTYVVHVNFGSEPSRIAAFQRRLLERLQTVPDTKAALGTA